MKKSKSPKSVEISLTMLFIAFASLLIFSSCNKDTDMKNSSMRDSSMKNKTMDNSKEKMDNSMNNMMDKKMNNMMNKMNGMKMSGNTDVDFVSMMIIHHQGAIDMATSEIASGKDENIKLMANNIVQDQQKEIATMQIWLEKNKDKKSTSGDNSKKLMESMNAMMNPDMKMTGDADKDFVIMMILHHQGAIEMAGVEINNGTDQEIKMMAQEILKKQKAEVDQMKEWQNSKTK